MLDLKPRLELHAIWHDVDIVELRIAAFSEHFAGRADVYSSYDQLESFANGIAGFPSGIEDYRRFQFATSEVRNRVSLTFFVANPLGLAAVEAQIFETQSSTESAFVRVVIEAAAIDEFAAQLRTIAADHVGSAILRGRIGVSVANML